MRFLFEIPPKNYIINIVGDKMNNKYQTNIIKIINEIKRTNQIPRNTKITIHILMYKDD